jgi:hypothetical protein
MDQRSKLPVVRKPVMFRGNARQESSSKPICLKLAARSAIVAASASWGFIELLLAFNRKLGEISGDCVCIHLVSAGNRRRVHKVRPAGLRPADLEGCR